MPRGRPRKNENKEKIEEINLEEVSNDNDELEDLENDDEEENSNLEFGNREMLDQIAILESDVDNTNLSAINAFNGEILSPRELIKKQKELLTERRQQILLLLDGKKLDEALKIIDTMRNLSEVFLDAEILGRVKENINTAMDLKFIAEAYGKFADKLNTLQRLDSLDSEGTAKKMHLSLNYRGSDGSELNASFKSD